MIVQFQERPLLKIKEENLVKLSNKIRQICWSDLRKGCKNPLDKALNVRSKRNKKLYIDHQSFNKPLNEPSIDIVDYHNYI